MKQLHARAKGKLNFPPASGLKQAKSMGDTIQVVCLKEREVVKARDGKVTVREICAVEDCM